jgi:endonuclease/exonuclease/phosphatase family metal-dependent hydrolase
MGDVRLRIATWNVHGFVGRDGRRDPARVAAALAAVGADLIALQEVDARSRRDAEPHPLDLLSDSLGMTAEGGPTLGRRGLDYGNAVLTRLEILEIRRHDLSDPRFEPRGAVEMWVAAHGAVIRFVATHLGLRRRERLIQARRIAAILDPPPRAADVLVVAGDVNAWWPWGREAAILERAVGPAVRPRTFPAHRPVLPLDRVFVQPRGAVVDAGVSHDPIHRQASDHLPVWVDLAITRVR